MHQLLRRLGLGVIGGAAGLLAMEVVRRVTAPLVMARAPKPTDVFLSERTISPLGPHHQLGEGPTEAVGRMAFEKVAGRAPSRRARRTLSWTVHISYGLAVAAAYAAIRADAARRPLRAGGVLGAGLWLLGDELALPLLGLADKPTAYHPTEHLQSLAQHLGFGIAAAATTHMLEGSR